MNFTRRHLTPEGVPVLSHNALQEVGEMTQIARKLVPSRGLVFLLAMILGAGLVLSGCGDEDTATTPTPVAPPPPPPEPDPEPDPEPEPPGMPTGLHVSATTETSITWMWNAVEGATGYGVQVSMDEMFDDSDTITQTLETSHTVMDLAPSTSVYARVAAGVLLEDGTILNSGWTTHVTGMSDMPPPEPEPEPDPVMVMFSLSEDAKSAHFLIADGDDDEATAMASVNSEITVTSNTSAIVEPMFVDGAAAVAIMAGDNMPFGLVDWGLMQSTVLSDGATFMITRTVVGANQGMDKTGDVAYVTCGPFNCADGMDAPEISIADSAVCAAWDPMVEIQVGKVDNDAGDKSDTTNETDGVDLGIVTSSSTAMTITHAFDGVAGGQNTSVKTDAAKGSNKTLTMKAIEGIIAVDDPDKSASVCNAGDFGYDDGDITDRPEGCFRLIGPGAMGRQDKMAPDGPDYLSGYSLILSAKGGGVSWGRVEWEEDPFEDLTCDTMTIMVADHVDVCSMFEDEVDYAIGDGWTPALTFNGADQVTHLTATAEKSEGKMFKTLWFDHDLDGKMSDSTNLYMANAMVSMSLLDKDMDPTVGDLGKVDLLSDEDDEETDVNESAVAGNPDGNADNYPDGGDQSDIRECSEADGGDDDDGTICDAEWMTDADVKFADRIFGCTTTRSFTVTCTWDADGGMQVGRNALPDAFDPDTPNNLKAFLKCEAE